MVQGFLGGARNVCSNSECWWKQGPQGEGEVVEADNQM